MDTNQFGCTVRRSTTHTLIKLTDEWFKAPERSNNFIRILFWISLKLLISLTTTCYYKNFSTTNFLHISLSGHWFFLQDREQFVSIGNKTSTILKSNAGTPQGTIAGPNDFKLLINDLLFDINNAKYVDDITMSSISTDPNDKFITVSD